ncbi:single-stranded DNA-binding protein [Bifidobacterium sp. 64T4]|uniref:single-stranded DNA-binding protein n=1 Tax=Bifidobacterium pongonis TaxID=2834432 RepID=UPI001C59F8C9|nr:single-stranded DNA-binding protein [Bifidobacterium pongonis]MBW3095176.1 single-stranded DNA-binding protein [Bifidobacterium pongonis]
MAGQQGTITLTGNLGMDPVSFSRDPNNPACSFNVGVSSGYFDQSSQSWRSRETVWIKVRAYRTLATNVMQSLHKGDAVVVTGALRMDRWTKDGVNRTAIVMDASAVGHDLNYGTSTFFRMNRAQQGDGDMGNAGYGAPGGANADGVNGVGVDPYVAAGAQPQNGMPNNMRNGMQNGGAPNGSAPNGAIPPGTPPQNGQSPNTGGQQHVAQSQFESTVGPAEDPEF